MTAGKAVPWLVAAGVAVALALVGLRPQGVSLVQAWLAVGILAVGATPMLVFLCGKHPAPIPVFPVAGLFYAVCFGLPVFLADVIWPADDPIIHYHSVIVADRGAFLNVDALALVLAGATLSSAFYYLAAAWLPRRMPRLTLPRDDATGRLVLLLGILLAAHVAYLFIPVLQRLPSVGQFLGPIGYLAFGGFYWLWRDGRISRRAALLIFAVILPVVILKKLAGGLLTPVILIGLFFFFLMTFFRNRAALVVCGLCAVLLLGGYGPITAFRYNTWLNPAFKTYSLSEKVEHAFAFHDSNENFTEMLVKSAGMVLHRVAFLAMFSRIVDQTPANVPYWRGATYVPLLTSMVPRILWPGKPEERAGYSFGVRYGFTRSDLPVKTSMNLPWIVEMFVNFGTLGVLIGMSLVGGGLAFLDRIFNRQDMTTIEAVVGLTIIFPLAYPEANFSLMTGSLLPLTISLWIYFRFGLAALAGMEQRILSRIRRR